MVGTPLLGLIVAAIARHRAFSRTFGIGLLLCVVLFGPLLGTDCDFRHPLRGSAPDTSPGVSGPRCVPTGGFSGDCP